MLTDQKFWRVNMKKLIYIANIRFPTQKAHGFQIAKMCESFAKLGLDVALLTPNRPTPITEEPLVFYNIKEKFKIETLPTWRVSMRPGFIGKIIYYLQGIHFAFAVLKRLNKESGDYVFSRDPFSALFLTIKGKKICYEIHDFPRVHWRNRWLLKNVEKIVVTNTHKKSALANKFGISKDKIFVAQNGVDLAPFVQEDKKQLRQKFNLPQDQKIVMYTGHLYSWKGVDTLLAAAKLLPKLEFVLVGGTKDDLAKYKEQYKDSSNVQFLGHKPQNQIPYFLMSSDCLVLPNTGKETISSFDTSPIKLFEYMASCVPVLASNINSIHEIVSGEEVEFFKADDAEDLAKKIDLVISNSANNELRVIRAWQKVQQFTWD